MDDEWSGHIDPQKGFAGVGTDDAVICLNHNPANVLELMDYPWQWMLSGHTHGRQVAYNGHLLYTFVGDKAAGDANGQGLGNIWFAVSASGDKAS